jgi:hypothetical protein
MNQSWLGERVLSLFRRRNAIRPPQVPVPAAESTTPLPKSRQPDGEVVEKRVSNETVGDLPVATSGLAAPTSGTTVDKEDTGRRNIVRQPQDLAPPMESITPLLEPGQVDHKAVERKDSKEETGEPPVGAGGPAAPSSRTTVESDDVIRVVGVSNAAPRYFMAVVDTLSRQSGIIRKDFPDNWDYGANLIWFQNARAGENHRDTDVLRIAGENWGGSAVDNNKYLITVVRFRHLALGDGIVGFFRNRAHVVPRDFVKHDTHELSWYCENINSEAHSILSEKVRKSSWFSRTRFAMHGRPEVPEGSGFLRLRAHFSEEQEIREIESEISLVLTELGISNKHRKPKRCKKCSRAVGDFDLSKTCLYCGSILEE